MKPLVKPQISINGTSRDQLVKQQIVLLEALKQAYEAMADAVPNGRDYQHRPAEFQPAQEAWVERMCLIETMFKDIENHAIEIQG